MTDSAPERRHGITVSVVLLVASLFVVAIGVQAYLSHEAGQERDRADRRYADCLTEFAADLVETIEARSEAGTALAEARAAEDDALDRLIEISQEARDANVEDESELPPSLIRRYERVLAERVRLQKKVSRLEDEAEAARAANPYVSPTVVCPR